MASFLLAIICPFWVDILKDIDEALQNLLRRQLQGVVRALTSRDRYAGQFNGNLLFDDEAHYGCLSEEEVVSCLKTRGCDVNNAEEREAKCAVCLDNLLVEDDGIINVARLECGHEYHIDCIKPWLRTNNRCPMCRATAIAYAHYIS